MALMEHTIFECRGCMIFHRGTVETALADGWMHILNIDGPNLVCEDCAELGEVVEMFRADGYENACLDNMNR